jgi:hypothetical protein
MANGRRIDPLPVFGLALIGGAAAWWLLTRKPSPKFVVGQKVALILNPAETGTVQGLIFGVSGVRQWFYQVLFDSTGTISLLEERFLFAV